MSTKLQRRILSLTAALAFFATVAADAYGLHACPHHDALPAPEQHETAPRSDHAHGGPVSAAHADADSHDAHGPCSCVGACSAATANLLHQPPALVLAVPNESTAATPFAEPSPRARILAHVLPYAHGPPLR